MDKHTVSDAGLLSVISNLKNLAIAERLARTSDVVARFLDTEQGIRALQETLEEHNAWRRLSNTTDVIPRAENLAQLMEIYNEHYLTTDIFFTHEDWLDAIFSRRDYQTLKELVGRHEAGLITIPEKELMQIRQNMSAYPLTVFSGIWLAVGKIEDLVSILRYENFRARDKERYIVPLLGRLLLTEEEALLLLRESLTTAPLVFEIVYTKHEKQGVQILQEEIKIGKDATLLDLQTIEASLYRVLDVKEAKETTRQFAHALVKERVKGNYSSKERDIAWRFLSSYLDVDRDNAFLLELRSLQTPDNELWLQYRLSYLLK